MSKVIIVFMIIILIIILFLLGFGIYWLIERERRRTITPTPTPVTPTSSSIISEMQNNWGTIKNQNNCLTAIGEPDKESKIEMSACVDPTKADNSSQLWRMTDNNALISIKDPNATYCLDVDSQATIGAGDPIHFWLCNQTDTKKLEWTPKIVSTDPLSYHLVNNQNITGCIDTTPGIGKEPILQTCNNDSVAQQWSFTPFSR
ncbi:putative B-type lectin protein [Cotonvirus japonicus]|uniref:B-type lectin protein n=1 Tax=Cotonvirus japonicus TaxID=2811091 RepID=A0ABM7NQY5_9VIRU|nr:putative B-type lectin protein [Cotonvirus japonicus]BCS82568.1 putative B-type lectin protein [Cotonvirus japonicus]